HFHIILLQHFCLILFHGCPLSPQDRRTVLPPVHTFPPAAVPETRPLHGYVQVLSNVCGEQPEYAINQAYLLHNRTKSLWCSGTDRQAHIPAARSACFPSPCPASFRAASAHGRPQQAGAVSHSPPEGALPYTA